VTVLALWCLILAAPAEAVELRGYGNVVWGMSIDDTRKHYPNIDDTGKDDITLTGMKTLRQFFFDGDAGLKEVRLTVLEGESLAVFGALRRLLIDKYGQPTVDMRFRARWRPKETEIILSAGRRPLLQYLKPVAERQAPLNNDYPRPSPSPGDKDKL